MRVPRWLDLQKSFSFSPLTLFDNLFDYSSCCRLFHGRHHVQSTTESFWREFLLTRLASPSSSSRLLNCESIASRITLGLLSALHSAEYSLLCCQHFSLSIVTVDWVLASWQPVETFRENSAWPFTGASLFFLETMHVNLFNWQTSWKP